MRELDVPAHLVKLLKKDQRTIEQHKEGHKSNRYAKEFGLALKPELYEKYNPIPSRKDAEEIEEWLANELRRQGYTVWFG